jgi:hypothetical protein
MGRGARDRHDAKQRLSGSCTPATDGPQITGEATSGHGWGRSPAIRILAGAARVLIFGEPHAVRRGRRARTIAVRRFAGGPMPATE